MTIKILVPLADGFEEIEAFTLIDVLRRAEMEVITTSISNSLEVTGAHGIATLCQSYLKDEQVLEYNAFILPGGLPGSTHLAESEKVIADIQQMAANDRWLGAICAAPHVLAKAGVLENRHATSYPSCKSQLKGAIWTDQDVVVDAKIITSRGVGTALAFALKWVEILISKEKSTQLAAAMLVDPPQH